MIGTVARKLAIPDTTRAQRQTSRHCAKPKIFDVAAPVLIVPVAPSLADVIVAGPLVVHLVVIVVCAVCIYLSQVNEPFDEVI